MTRKLLFSMTVGPQQWTSLDAFHHSQQTCPHLAWERSIGSLTLHLSWFHQDLSMLCCSLQIVPWNTATLYDCGLFKEAHEKQPAYTCDLTSHTHDWKSKVSTGTINLFDSFCLMGFLSLRPIRMFLLFAFFLTVSEIRPSQFRKRGRREEVFFYFPQCWKDQASCDMIWGGEDPPLTGSIWGTVWVISCVSRPFLMIWSRWRRDRFLCCSWTSYPALSATPPSSSGTQWEPHRSLGPQNRELLSWSGSSSSELRGLRWETAGCFQGESDLGPSNRQTLCRFA